MTAEDDREVLRDKAQAARRLASEMNDALAARHLLQYAESLEARIEALEAAPELPPAAAIPSGEPPIARAGAALKPEVPSGPELPPHSEESSG